MTCSYTFKGHTFKVNPIENDYWGGEGPIMEKYWNIKKGDVVMDIGCATGIWALPAMACGANMVYCIDGDNHVLKGLVENIQLNGFKNFIIMRGAVYNEDKQWTLAEGWETMGIPKEFTEPIMGSDEISFRKIDSFFLGDKLDWIKLDIEGFELAALEGGIETLKKHHPKLVIENHTNVDHIGPWMQQNSIWQKIIDLLHGLNYRIQETSYEGRGFLYAE